MKYKKVTIVGGGSSAHVLGPLLSGAGYSVRILTRRPREWAQCLRADYVSPEGEILESFSASHEGVSDDPGVLIPDADIIILCLPVSSYRAALENIGPYISKKRDVIVGTIYGQGGFNWMVNALKRKYGLKQVKIMALGLIPWICRVQDYGKRAVTYGPKAVNVMSCDPPELFHELTHFQHALCEKWFSTGGFQQAANFLSLTLSVDNQIIHTSRMFGLHERYGGIWKREEDVDYFYRDYDELSAGYLRDLDSDYSLIRDRICHLYPEKDFTYMLDYLALERLSYASANTDIRKSFTKSKTLGAIKTPVVQRIDGLWTFDRSHRFFYDDIFYGLCVSKWMAQKMNLRVDTVDRILLWAQSLLQMEILDTENGELIESALMKGNKSGIPSVYGYEQFADLMNHEEA